MNLNRVCMDVDLDAVLANMEAMHKNISDHTKMMAVIKTDAYGHGAVEIATLLESLDYVFGYAVATADEAFELREHGIQKPILILGYTFPEDYAAMAGAGIRPAVYTYEMAKAFSDAAASIGVTAPIHIKIDTGMSRIGFQVTEEDADTIASIGKLPNLHLEGIFTHFARADEKDKSHAFDQMNLFNHMIDLCAQRGVNFDIKHCSNSAGILEIPEANMDMVRAGITVYGLWPSDEMDRSFPLVPVMSLHSHVVHVKTLTEGRAISYGGTYVVHGTRRIATIPVGYGDGYARGLSNKGFVLIHGRRAPITGRVCMDQFMCDVTDIPDVQDGDLVTLVGRDGDEQITLEELGDLSGRFNYEFACLLGNRRVPKRFLKGGKQVGLREDFS